MGAWDEFERNITESGKKFVKPQLVWATADDVDWDRKIMSAISVVDGLPYYDVLLGIGSIYKKPKKGSKCLLGVLENKAAATFLIEAEEIEEMLVKSGLTSFTINEDGFIVKQDDESLKTILNDFMDEVNKIVVIQGNTIDVAAVNSIKDRLNQVLTQ